MTATRSRFDVGAPVSPGVQHLATVHDHRGGARKPEGRQLFLDDFGRMRTGEERLLGLLQGCHGLLAAHGRKVLEEVGKGLPCQHVVKQRGDRSRGLPGVPAVWYDEVFRSRSVRCRRVPAALGRAGITQW
jgi:hypothetical protein